MTQLSKNEEMRDFSNEFSHFVWDVLNEQKICNAQKIFKVVQSLLMSDKSDDLEMVLRLHFPNQFWNEDYIPFTL